MKKDNMTYLRRALEKLSSEQLGAMLREELRDESPDGDKIRLIMRILEEREKDLPPKEMTSEVEEAWAKYLRHIKSMNPVPTRRTSRILKMASAAAVLALILMVFPQKAEAESIFDRLVRWTDNIFALLSSEDEEPPAEYVFQTDNPGLREVYDAVVELGITEPVVPMWLPEGYELVECKFSENRICKGIAAEFTTGNNTCIISVNVYLSSESKAFYKSEIDAATSEIDGRIHSIIKNKELWMSVWTKDNIEATIAIDCQEDIFYNILESIYTMEDI